MTPKISGVTILGQIGNGAGSVVFKAKDDRTGQYLAIKSVTPAIVREIQGLAPSPEYGGDQAKLLKVYRTQVRNEWKIGRHLTNLDSGHTGIPRMHRLVVRRKALLFANELHLVMDFIDGENLRKNREYSIDQLISIYRQAADILQFMHRNDIVHADFKPHHVMVNEKMEVRLLDLGLACHRKGHATQVTGSPSYMAPEQLVGAGVDERTDVFGLGATMFWALTGRTIRPNVAGAGTGGAVDLQIKPFETSVRRYNRDTSPALEDVVLLSCAPSRRARLTLGEVISRLDRLS